jgi:hypothetical protein
MNEKGCMPDDVFCQTEKQFERVSHIRGITTTANNWQNASCGVTENAKGCRR